MQMSQICFLRFKLTIGHHKLKQWLGAETGTFQNESNAMIADALSPGYTRSLVAMYCNWVFVFHREGFQPP